MVWVPGRTRSSCLAKMLLVSVAPVQPTRKSGVLPLRNRAVSSGWTIRRMRPQGPETMSPTGSRVTLISVVWPAVMLTCST